MTVSLGVVMDRIDGINPKKDTTLLLLLAAQARGWTLFYMELRDLHLSDGEAYAHARRLEVFDSTERWFSLSETASLQRLADLDVVLMRKDPPFDVEYVFATYVLERAQQGGCRVVNDPRSLRDANEKLFTAWFPQCCPPTLVTRRHSDIQRFAERHIDIVIKPLDGMGGASVFRIRPGDFNRNVILETMTRSESRFVMVQKFLPQIVDGDKRILLIDGEPVPYALARIPASGEFRGNLAVGGRGEGRPLTERDRWICNEVSAALRLRGLLFVGLDVIGDYLTEINVTSPTCARELQTAYDIDIGGQLMSAIEHRLAS